jgi:hypothetical protein
MMFMRSLLAFSFTLACWLGSAPVWAEPLPPTAYFPLAVGNKWVYEFSQSPELPPVYESISVQSRTGDAFFMWIKDDYMLGDVLTGDGHQEVIYRTSDGFGYNSRTVKNPHVLGDNPQLFLKTPLTMNATWENDWGKYHVTAVDVTEKVPAGTFRDCIEVTFRANSGDVTIVSLYAPGVGLIMRDETFIAIAFAGGGPVRALLRLKDWQVRNPQEKKPEVEQLEDDKTAAPSSSQDNT